MQLGRGETVEDTGKVLSRYVDAIMIRARSHADVEQLAHAATVPVINGLTDLHHPCQALADMQTLRERLGPLQGRRLAWVGDGCNNVCHSLITAAGRLEMEVVVAAPRATSRTPRCVAAAGDVTSPTTRWPQSPAPTLSPPTSGSAWARRTSATGG